MFGHVQGSHTFCISCFSCILEKLGNCPVFPVFSWFVLHCPVFLDKLLTKIKVVNFFPWKMFSIFSRVYINIIALMAFFDVVIYKILVFYWTFAFLVVSSFVCLFTFSMRHFSNNIFHSKRVFSFVCLRAMDPTYDTN